MERGIIHGSADLLAIQADEPASEVILLPDVLLAAGNCRLIEAAAVEQVGRRAEVTQ